VDWTGPLVPLVEKIAAMTDYRVKVMGNDPGIPVLVSVNAKRAVIADILQNASLQAGKKAQILVFPSSRLIEVRYVAQ
jgi:defect-in-organelle-trafficking protein DotD